MRCLRCRRSKSCQEEALVAGAVVRQMLCRQRALADAVVRCALMSMMLYGSSFASESGDRYAMLSAMRNLGELRAFRLIDTFAWRLRLKLRDVADALSTDPPPLESGDDTRCITV